MFDHLFQTISLGPLTLKNRVMSPPHGHLVSSLWGSEQDAAAHIAYWAARTGAGWIDGVSAHLRNPLIPGFEPTGVGSQVHGHYRLPFFVDRVGRLADTVRADGTALTVQMILQAGMPHGASAIPSGPIAANVPHPLTTGEIDWFVEEYRHGASQIAAAGADGVELHLNHDDLMEHFISPLTNRRDDEYGGSLDNRLRFARRILAELRSELGSERVVGIRLNIHEDEPGGFDQAGAIQIATALQDSGLIDYVSLVAGSPWGSPSYIQSHHHQPGEWAPQAGQIRAHLDLPVVYTGRVTSPEVGESIVASGQADIVGMARAFIADGDFMAKAASGQASRIRPCVGGNECINRRLVDNLSFSCTVNPAAGREARALGPSPARRRVLVIGGGPAGSEVARISAERGHNVTLWEASDHLGGQLAIAAKAPRYDDFAAYLAWQERELDHLGVTVQLGNTATVSSVRDHDADLVVVATGARPRRPWLPGVDLSHVHLGADVLNDLPADLGHHVVLAAQEDHVAPLAIADFLAEHGHLVTLVHGSAAPAPAVSRYLLGSALARLDLQGVQLVSSHAVTAIHADSVDLRHVYSQRVRNIAADAVVLSYGGDPEHALHDELTAAGISAHLLGDAFAPRTLTFATRQAYDLVASW